MLCLCGDSVETSRAVALVGTVGFLDGVPQNASQFNNSFQYLVTPIAGSSN
ncbi:MAG: hypothetical protein ACI8UP_000927 [Porticoccaceae bacterium]|jgi:hypothetical protein